MTDSRIAEIQARLNATRAIYELGDFLTESEVLDLVGSSEFLLSRLAEAEGRIEQAPHGRLCGTLRSKPCTCWKSRAALSVSPEPKEGK
jgi:hypothetical protein